MNYKICRYQEVLKLFSQDVRIEEKTIKQIDNNGNEFDIVDHIQFPDYMGLNVNILLK